MNPKWQHEVFKEMNVSHLPAAQDRLNILEALRFAWTRFRLHAPLLVAVGLANMGVSYVVGRMLPKGVLFLTLQGLLGIAISLLLISLQFSLAQGRTVDWMGVMSRITWRKFASFVGVSVCLWVVGFFGTLLLVIPGVIWGLMFSQAGLLVLDRDLSTLEALKESARLTMGFKGTLFGCWLVIGALILLVLLPLIVFLRLGMEAYLGPLGLALLNILIVPVDGLVNIRIYRFLQDRAA